jgi:hypothetical protein
MTAFESLALAYFAVLAAVTPAAVVPWRRRLLVASLSLASAALVLAIGRAGSDVLRAWAPHAYLVTGYWLPALIAPRPATPTRFERWLATTDRRLRAGPGVPRLLVHVTELAYLLCYPLVPAAFVVVWREGQAADATRFWVTVLLAGYACYVPLPWLVSRPPRLVQERLETRHALGDVNRFVLGRVSHGLNTFPSGHVAVATACALALRPVSFTAGIFAAVVALAIAVGAAAGRYHYVIDVLLGLIVGAAAAAIAARLVGAPEI